MKNTNTNEEKTGIASVEQDGNRTTVTITDAEKFAAHLEAKTAELTGAPTTAQEQPESKPDSPYIRKVKSNGHALVELHVEEEITINDETNTVKKVIEFRHAMHDDMKNALRYLTPFLVDICEYDHICIIPMLDTDPEQVMAAFEMEKYKITGFTMGGSGEHEGVVLIGQRTVQENKVLNLITPFIKFQDEHNPYRHAGLLETFVRAAQAEALAYSNGKAAPPAQLELDLDAA